jgi:hypothetical protein
VPVLRGTLVPRRWANTCSSLTDRPMKVASQLFVTWAVLMPCVATSWYRKGFALNGSDGTLLSSATYSN